MRRNSGLPLDRAWMLRDNLPTPCHRAVQIRANPGSVPCKLWSRSELCRYAGADL